MGENALRELLNRLRWDAVAETAGVALLVRHRVGDASRLTTVSFAEIVEVGPAGVSLVDGTFLPYHRIAAVERDGRTLWRSRREETWHTSC